MAVVMSHCSALVCECRVNVRRTVCLTVAMRYNGALLMSEASLSLRGVFTDHISVGANALASAYALLSARPSVRLFPLYLRNQLTADLELFHAGRS